MSFFLADPTGEFSAHHPPDKQSYLNGLLGKKVGYIFNKHGSALAFWTEMEKNIAFELRPSAVHRLYKENTWAPASESKVSLLISETDYALIGFGA